ncbi:hypothetical protein Mgra_00004756 [Meloidogyne graminicola]|jgi:hypothetical protein
MDVN